MSDRAAELVNRLGIPVGLTIVASVIFSVIWRYGLRKAKQPAIESGAKSELPGQQVTVWTPGFTEIVAFIAILNIALLIYILWPDDE